MISEKDMEFVADFLECVATKVSLMAERIGANFPSASNGDGTWDALGEKSNVANWTSGFWPGMMWLMYIKTGDSKYRTIAEKCEERMDEALCAKFDELHHDVGFMWILSSVASYKLTGNEVSKKRALHAATILAGRYNHYAKFIRAWDFGSIGGAIIDCMMNIQLLYWASEETKDPRFAQIATAHATTAMNHFVRPDGSVNHIVEFDPETGDVVNVPRGQGYAEGSSWSRGQAWALYGFVLAYINSGRTEFLDTAKRVAHYFIANITEGELPLVDFRAPAEPVYYDASAAAIAACGLIEISKTVGEYESIMYENATIKLLRALEKDCNFGKEKLCVLQRSSGAYHMPKGIHLPWIFGDYYLLEALMKLYGNDGSFSLHKNERQKI